MITLCALTVHAGIFGMCLITPSQNSELFVGPLETTGDLVYGGPMAERRHNFPGVLIDKVILLRSFPAGERKKLRAQE